MTEKISKLRPTLPRQKTLEIFNYLGEIFNGPKTDDEQPNITDMPELESEEFAAQKNPQKNPKKEKTKTESARAKILTPSQMLSRLPISLAQVKTGNN